MTRDLVLAITVPLAIALVLLALSGCGKITHEVTGGATVNDPTVHCDPLIIATPNWLEDIVTSGNITVTLPPGHYTISGNELIVE